MQKSDHLGHIRALDGLRGFALLLVVAYHALSGELTADSLLGALAKKFALTGWIGVDLFFVLSGYLITSILLEARASSNYFSVFYARRALRIFPLYYLVLVASLLVMPGHFAWKTQVFYWFNLSNLPTAFYSRYIPYLAHFWSLAIEEQFYFVWPALVLLMRPKKLASLCLAVILAVLVMKNLPIILALNHKYPEFIYRFTPFRVDTLCAGALLAILARHRPNLIRYRRTLQSICVASGLVFLAVGFGKSYNALGIIRVGYTALVLCFCSLIALALNPGLTARLFSNPFLRSTGKYSYAFYLFHPFLINLVASHLSSIVHAAQNHGLRGVSPNLILVLIVMGECALLFGICALSWRLFEEPILRQKKHFRYQPARLAVPLVSVPLDPL